MKKQGTVVSVHTIVDNNTKTSDDDDDRKNYSSEQFTEVVVLFGQAMRKAAFLHINKHIIIVAGVMRSKETASVHQELLASCCDEGMPKHSEVAMMYSYFLDNVTQHKKLRCLYQHTSNLYSTISSEKNPCRKADIFFLEKFPVGQVHHYNCCNDNPISQVLGGWCLCILISKSLDQTVSGTLTLAGGESARTKFAYKMSSGDSCLVFGMVCCLPDTTFLPSITIVPNSVLLPFPLQDLNLALK